MKQRLNNLHITSVWQYGGLSAKSKISASFAITAGVGYGVESALTGVFGADIAAVAGAVSGAVTSDAAITLMQGGKYTIGDAGETAGRVLQLLALGESLSTTFFQMDSPLTPYLDSQAFKSLLSPYEASLVMTAVNVSGSPSGRFAADNTRSCNYCPGQGSAIDYMDYNGDGDISVWEGGLGLLEAGSWGVDLMTFGPSGEGAAASFFIRGIGKNLGKTYLTRKLWILTAEGASKIVKHNKWGKFYKDAKTGLWWSNDITKHGKKYFKVFEEGKTGLTWIKDADEYGQYIEGIHKSKIGKYIPWKKLNTVK